MSENAPKNYQGKHEAPRNALIKSRAVSKLLQRVVRKEGLVIEASTDLEQIKKSRAAREIITNDGSTTLAVHGTSKAAAEKITKEGLVVRPHYDDPDKPDLNSTLFMLAGANEPDAVRQNTHGLAYRFDGDHIGDTGGKVVLNFTRPNPGTSRKIGESKYIPGNVDLQQFDDTFLEQPDGVNLIRQDDGTFLVPPSRVMGVFNLDDTTFAPNSGYVAPEHIAQTANEAATMPGRAAPHH